MKEILKTFLSVAAVLLAAVAFQSANAATPAPAGGAEPGVFQPINCNFNVKACPLVFGDAFCANNCGPGWACTVHGFCGAAGVD